jgi:hypothetical protein
MLQNPPYNSQNDKGGSICDLLPTCRSTFRHKNPARRVLRSLACIVALVLFGCSLAITCLLFAHFNICPHDLPTNSTGRDFVLYFTPVENATSSCEHDDVRSVEWLFSAYASCGVFLIARVYNMRGKGRGHLCTCRCDWCTSFIDGCVSKACPLMLAYTTTIEADGSGFRTTFTHWEQYFTFFLIAFVALLLSAFVASACAEQAASCCCRFDGPKCRINYLFCAVEGMLLGAVVVGVIQWVLGVIQWAEPYLHTHIDDVSRREAGDTLRRHAHAAALIAYNPVGHAKGWKVLFTLLSAAGIMNAVLEAIDTILELSCGVGEYLRKKLGINKDWEDAQPGQAMNPLSETFLPVSMTWGR